VFNGGIGFLNACHVATQLIRAGKCSTAMVATAEVENNPPGAAERRGLVETGSAVILERSATGRGFGRMLFRSFARYGDAGQAYSERTGASMVMRLVRDPRLEEYYLECIAEVVGELLAREELDLSRVRTILPPQISPAFVARLSDCLGAERRTVVDLAGGGDYFTSSLACSFERAGELGLVEPGEIGLVIEVGNGIQVGCATYHF
jgi:3-oxoacyl-[acyl-carrier-protein] synthase III